MYRVLLVDDEPWALKGIKNTFKWDKWRFNVIGETTNSLEALDIILKQKPDVVFTDIRMPGITGIELIQKTREQGVGTEFVIVSGFAEFSYAREAVRNGAFDYCLKPLDLEEADKLLARLFHTLENKRSILEADVMETIMNGDGILELFTRMGFNCSERYYQAMVTLYDGRTFKRPSLYLSGTPNRLDIGLGRNKTLYLLNMDNNKIIIQDSVINACIGMSSVSECLNDLPGLYREADMAASSNFIYGTNGVYEYKKKRTLITCDLVEKLINGVELRKLDEIKDILKGVPSFFKENALYMDDLVYFWNQIVAFITRKYPAKSSNIGLEFMDYEKILHHFFDINSMIEYLVTEISYLIDRTGEASIFIANESFKKLLNYIHEHFSEQLCLRDLAGNFYINQTYCCDLFKKATGNTFSEYLTGLRMDKAKELLKNESLTIDEIAQRVGYDDYFYFNKVFKKWYNITPAKYRRSLQ